MELTEAAPKPEAHPPKKVSPAAQIDWLRETVVAAGGVHQVHREQLVYLSYATDASIDSPVPGRTPPVQIEFDFEAKVLTYRWLARRPLRVDRAYRLRLASLEVWVRRYLGDWRMRVFRNRVPLFPEPESSKNAPRRKKPRRRRA